MRRNKTGWYIDVASAVDNNQTKGIEHVDLPAFKLMEDAIAHIKTMFDSPWLFFRLSFRKLDGTMVQSEWRLKGDW